MKAVEAVVTSTPPSTPPSSPRNRRPSRCSAYDLSDVSDTATLIPAPTRPPCLMERSGLADNKSQFAGECQQLGVVFVEPSLQAREVASVRCTPQVGGTLLAAQQQVRDCG